MSTKTNKRERRGQASGSTSGKQERRGQPSALTSGKRSPGGRKGRKPIAPVKVGKDRNWGPIALFTVVGVLAAGLIGFAFWAQRDVGVLDWQERAAAIEGIINYRESKPEVTTVEYRNHQDGPLEYETTPPAYGTHNDTWQNCEGDVYGAQIANEHAVHSLEHGAVWITYDPEQVPADQVEELAELVRSNDKMMMSPYPELDSPISLQAWGYQLKTDRPDDPRIMEFIRALRVNTSLEGPTALCSNGITTTGTTPITTAGGMER